MTIYNFQSKIRNPSATLRTGPKSAIALTLLLVLTSGLVAPHPALAATLTVNTLLDENDGSCADGDCSLRDAIQVAAPGDTIIFGITGTIILTLGQLTVDKDLTLSGPGQDSLTLSGNNTSRIFWITAGNVAFSGLTIANGYADNGGGMYNSISNPTLTEVTFNGNFATSSGGGIYNIGSHPTLNNVTFNSNSATYGGGMYNNWSSPKLMNVTFSGNPASGHGGGMYNEDYSNPTLTNVTFSGNSASDSGGGMYNMSSSPTLTNVTFSSNLALYGGGMFNVYGNPTLTNVTFSGNSAYFDGGGMYSYGNNSALTDVTFSGNLATHGGGMYNYSGYPTITNATFSSNSASEYGGGMNNYSSNPTLTNVTFSGNSASSGGGIYNYPYGSSGLTNVTLTDNTATISGGGIYNGARLKNTILAGNTAPGGPDCFGFPTSFGYNLIQDISGCTISGDETGNIYGQAPLLGPLQNNGGDTLTHALLPGSPAIDTASCTDLYDNAVTQDQRGIVRPQGSSCDMGAYEVVVSGFSVYLSLILR